MEEKKLVAKIDSVKSGLPVAPKTAMWTDVIKSFNPFGQIGEAYANTLRYKIECKRLDAEVERIRSQANMFNNVIDKNFQLKVMELENRRAELLLSYQAINKTLDDLHIERMTVLNMAKEASSKVLDSSIPLEERKLYKEMATEMTSQLPMFGDKANETLKNIIQALPPVNVPLAITDGAD